MRTDAQLALAGLSPTSPYRATMLHTEGVSHLLDGDLDRADSIFAHAFVVATSAGAVPLLPVVLTERGIVAIERDDWHEAAAFAERALSFVQDGSLDRYWTSALVYAFGARCAMHRGAVELARDYVGGPLGSGRCSPTRCPSCRPRPCSSWRAATPPSATSVVPVRCCAKRRTSSSNGPSSGSSRNRQPSSEPS